MPRLSKSDSALRAVILGKSSLKTKLEAFAGIESHSETFLTEIVSSPDTHSKLKTKAADRLAQVRHRREVDFILAEETARLSERDPIPVPVPAAPVQAPTPVTSETKLRPENEQAIPPKITVAQPIPAQAIPVAVIPESTPAKAQPPGTASNLTAGDERKPIFTLPRGAILERDEQNRLLELFQTILDSSKTESQRQGARNQLEKTIRMPDAGRSMFSLYLLETLEWLDRHPEQKPKALPAPPSEPNPEYDVFTFSFSITRMFQNIAEQERLFKARERVADHVEQGGFWDGLPAI